MLSSSFRRRFSVTRQVNTNKNLFACAKKYIKVFLGKTTFQLQWGPWGPIDVAHFQFYVYLDFQFIRVKRLLVVVVIVFVAFVVVSGGSV